MRPAARIEYIGSNGHVEAGARQRNTGPLEGYGRGLQFSPDLLDLRILQDFDQRTQLWSIQARKIRNANGLKSQSRLILRHMIEGKVEGLPRVDCKRQPNQPGAVCIRKRCVHGKC